MARIKKASDSGKRMSIQRYEAKIDQLRAKSRVYQRQIKSMLRERRALLDTDERFLSVVPTEDDMIRALIRKSDRYTVAIDKLLTEANELRQAAGQSSLNLADILEVEDIRDHSVHESDGHDSPADETSNPESISIQNEYLLAQMAGLETEISDLGRKASEVEELRQLVDTLHQKKRPLELTGGEDDANLLEEECQNLRGELDVTRAANEALIDARKNLSTDLDALTKERENLQARLTKLSQKPPAPRPSAEDQRRMTQQLKESLKESLLQQDTESQREMETLRDETEKLRGENQTLVGELEKARHVRAAFEQRLQQAESLAAASANKDSESTALRSEVERLGRELVEAQQETQRQQANHEALVVETAQEGAEVEKLKQTIQEHEAKVERLSEELDEQTKLVETRTRQEEESRETLAQVRSDHGSVAAENKELLGRLEVAEERLKGTCEERETLAQELAVEKQARHGAEARVANSQESLSQALVDKQAFHALDREKQELGSALEKARAEQRDIEGRRELTQADLSALRGQLNDAQQALTATGEQTDAARSERDDLRQQLELVRSEGETLLAKAREAEEEMSRTRIEQESLKINVATLSEQLSLREENSSKQEVELESLRGAAGQTQSALERTETEREWLQGRTTELEQSLETLKSAKSSDAAIQDDLAQACASLLERETELQLAEEERDRIEQEFIKVQAALEQANRELEKGKRSTQETAGDEVLRAEVQAIRAELEGLKTDRAQGDVDYDVLAELEAQIALIESRLSQASDQLTGAAEAPGDEEREPAAVAAQPAPPAEPTVITPGAPLPVIEGFEVLDLIGSGSIGRVYRVRKVNPPRLVAFKVLHDERAADEAYVSNLRKVLPQLSRLGSPHILRQICPGRMGSLIPVAMDYCEGGNLLTRLENGALTEADALHIVRQLTDALHVAHGAGHVHRNIKPTNILFNGSGSAVLADYATSTGRDDGSLTLPSGVTYGYGAPEVLRGEPEIDVRADIFSLGAVLYHMLTGRAPFSGSSLDEIAEALQAGQAPWPCEINDAISMASAQLVVRMMAREPDQRPADPEALRPELESAAIGQPLAGDPLPPGASVVQIPAPDEPPATEEPS